MYVEKGKNLTIATVAKEINKPTLIIHCDSDTSIPHTEAEKLKSRVLQRTLITIKKANHIFGAQHPWERDFLSNDLKCVVEETIKFAIL